MPGVSVKFKYKFAPLYIEESMPSPNLQAGYVRVSPIYSVISGKLILNAYGSSGPYADTDYAALGSIGEITESAYTGLSKGDTVIVPCTEVQTSFTAPGGTVLKIAAPLEKYLPIFHYAYTLSLIQALEQRGIFTPNKKILIVGTDVFSILLARFIAVLGLPCSQFLGQRISQGINFPEQYDIVFDSRVSSGFTGSNKVFPVDKGWYIPIIPGVVSSSVFTFDGVNIYKHGISKAIFVDYIAECLSEIGQSLALSDISPLMEFCKFRNLFPAILSDKRFVVVGY